MSNIMLPVALFVYKRVDHLERTINSLKHNHLSQNVDLHIFSDGPKKPEDKLSVDQVRNYIKNISDFSKVTIRESAENRGLAKSIISGVTEVLDIYDRVIVIEDDLELSPYFLTYMNEALNLYQDNPKVASIHGYTLPVKAQLPDTFFLKGADCWGWGTWKRAWDIFEKDGKILLDRLSKEKLMREFDLDGLVGNSQMLKDQIAGKNDSWAIRWHASCFLNNMLTLHPGKSLVKNIGLDGSGEHCIQDLSFDSNLNFNPTAIISLELKESVKALEIYKKFYRTQKTSFLKRIVSAFRRKMSYAVNKLNKII
jgi:hypothetical protein